MKEGKNSGRICTGLLVAAMLAVIGAGMSFWYTGAHADVTPNSVIYVTESGSGAKDGTSWENAMAGVSLDAAAAQAKVSFDAAVAQAKPETAPVVWVANGIYTRTKTLTLDKGVRMYGGFNGTEKSLAERPSITPDAEFTSTDTIISRDATLVSTDKFSLITGGYRAVSADTVLDGFTVTGGIAQFGGGMYNNGSSTSVVNCTFIANHGNEGGGMYNLGGSPSILNCTFAENDADNGGGMNNSSYSSPTITGSVFSVNHADLAGGGMNNYNASSKVSNCAFAGNSAGSKHGGNGGGVYN